jgi:hypothetical protein
MMVTICLISLVLESSTVGLTLWIYANVKLPEVSSFDEETSRPPSRNVTGRHLGPIFFSDIFEIVFTEFSFGADVV